VSAASVDVGLRFAKVNALSAEEVRGEMWAFGIAKWGPEACWVRALAQEKGWNNRFRASTMQRDVYNVILRQYRFWA